MALSLPGAICLISHMQEYLCHVYGKMFMLTRGVHVALSEF